MTPATNTTSTSAKLGGHLLGGNQPVVGANVMLYAAGTSGYGSASTLYAQTTSQNDAYGSFAFQKSDTSGIIDSSGSAWSCPSSGDPQMYLVATGGNSQGNYGTSGASTNSAIGMIAALGACSTITNSTFVNMNEVTSAATMAALQQYFNPNTLSLGAPSATQAQTGFANAVTTIANLVNISTGVAATSTTPTGTLNDVTVTATPEYQKLNTLADIIASCVNSATASSTSCTTLFSNAAVPSSASVTSQPSISYPSSPNNVLQALYYMLINPTNGSTTALTNLYGLVTAAAPFQPTLTSAPSDWTIGIRYNSTSACSIGSLLSYPNNVAIDSSGNVYVNNSVTASPTLGGFAPNGGPILCAGNSSLYGSSYGLAIDSNDSVYMSTYTTSASATDHMLVQTASGSTSLWSQPSGTIEGLSLNNNGDLFAYDYSAHQAYDYGGAASASSAGSQPIPSVVGSTTGPSYGVAMATDGLSNTLIVNATTTSSLSAPYLLTADSSSTTNFSVASIGNASGLFGYTYAVAVSSSNVYKQTSSFWVGNYCSASSSACRFPGIANTLVPITFSKNTPTVGTATAACAGGIFRPRNIAIDGAQNVWVTNYNLTGGSVSELSASGTALSPAYNGTCTDATTGSTAIGGFQKSLFVNYPKGIAVDPSGNVWIAQGVLATDADTPGGLVEIVGAAVPVVTPIALGLKNNTVGATPGTIVSAP